MNVQTALNRGFGAVAALVLSASCATTPAAIASPSATGQVQSGTPTAAPKLEDRLVLGAIGGSIQTGLQTCAIDSFEKKTNVRVEYVAAQPAELLAKAVAQKSNPAMDVEWVSSAEQYRGDQQNLFAQLDESAVPNLRNVPAEFKDVKVGAPFGLSTSGIEYNTQVFKDRNFPAPTSWNDLWDPRFKGHAAIYTISILIGHGFLVTVAELNGGSVSNIDPGFRRISELRPNLYTVVSTAPQLDQLFQQGNVWIAVNSGARTQALKASGVPVEFVQPKEGVIAGHSYFELLKGAPHPNAGAAFIDWILSDDVQSCLAGGIGYAPVVRGAKVPSDLSLYLYPSGKIVDINWVAVQDQLTAWISRWNKEIEGR